MKDAERQDRLNIDPLALVDGCFFYGCFFYVNLKLL
jgi:hypothetical protein